jgi:hypothetical protein
VTVEFSSTSTGSRDSAATFHLIKYIFITLLHSTVFRVARLGASRRRIICIFQTHKIRTLTTLNNTQQALKQKFKTLIYSTQ